MNTEHCNEDFEARLLDHVEMLYGVALSLTGNPREAGHITRITMLEAWEWRQTWEDSRSLKSELLSLLRRKYITQTNLATSASERRPTFLPSIAGLQSVGA